MRIKSNLAESGNSAIAAAPLVPASLRGRAWVLREADERLATAIAQSLGVPEIIGRILAGRGIGLRDAARYLKPNLKDDLPDPSSLMDMDRAATRLADAIAAGEAIGIFGDYDVDGATSSALLARFIRGAGGRALVAIPDRLRDGYGPNLPALLALKDQGARLIVTVDCGAQAHDVLARAQRAGIEIIVCDHHQMAETAPPAIAVVNPNRPDDISGLGQLAAVGVAFLMAVAVNRILRARSWYSAHRAEPELLPLVALAGLGTVADVVPLTGVNRALVTAGIKQMARAPSPGLAALMQVSGMKGEIEPYHLGFLLGPRVNAGGRVGLCSLGSDLLSTDDSGEALRIAVELDRLNRERQAIEHLVIEDAMAQAEALSAEGRQVLVISGEGWHPGVIGIVAGRIKERFAKPAFVIAVDGGVGKGSGRSIAGVDLGAAVAAARAAGLLINGGGHAMAAGLTIEATKIAAFSEDIERRLHQTVARSAEGRLMTIDGILMASGVNEDMARALAQAGPFGSGNPEPLFMVPDVRIVQAATVGTDHVRFVAADKDKGRLKGVAFRSAGTPLGEALLNAKGRPMALAGAIKAQTWNNAVSAEMRLVDAAFQT